MYMHMLIQYSTCTFSPLWCLSSLCVSSSGCFLFPEKSCPGGRVYAMASTGEVEKRIWVATSVSKNYPVSTTYTFTCMH